MRRQEDRNPHFPFELVGRHGEGIMLPLFPLCPAGLSEADAAAIAGETELQAVDGSTGSPSRVLACHNASPMCTINTQIHHSLFSVCHGMCPAEAAGIVPPPRPPASMHPQGGEEDPDMEAARRAQADADMALAIALQQEEEEREEQVGEPLL